MRVPPPYEQTMQQPLPSTEGPADKTVVDFPLPRHEPPAGSGRSDHEARTGKTRRSRVLAAAGLAAVLVVGGGGAYAIARLTGSSPGGPDKAKDGLVTVTDTTGRLSLRVPPPWKLQTQHNRWPVSVGDGATAPALRATPDYGQFVQEAVAVPGVFAGLTHDLNVPLPPATLGNHRARCTRGTDRAYRHGSLSGQITPWTCSGSITIDEVGLRDSGGRYAIWVRVKQTGPPDLTRRILDSIRTKG
jgi:hypothetical protein